MINIPSKSKIKVTWKVNTYDYSREKEKNIIAAFSKKYSIPKNQITVDVKQICLNEKGEEVSLTKDIVENIQKPEFHQKLFKDYLRVNNIEDYDFDIFKKIDSEINANIDYEQYDKFKQYKINWVRFDNFLSYGEDNFFDFTKLNGMVLLNGEPANQSGKTTFAIDLIHFLLFGKTDKSPTLDKIFNKHIPEATKVLVEGSLTIDGQEYIIRRQLTRTSLDKRNSKSRTTQNLDYFQVVNGELIELENIDDKREESTTKTNKAIKEAIGNESDFDMIISTTNSNLDELIEKKDTERGRLLARWIGLLPIEKKDELARNKFNTEVKPYLESNRYSIEELKQEIDAYNINIKTLNENISKYEKENSEIEKEIEFLENQKETLLQTRRVIDEDVLKIDITTLNTSIERLRNDGISKKNDLDEINKKIEELGDIDFSIEKYDNLVKESGELAGDIKVHRQKTLLCKQDIKNLTSSEYCPTCGKKYDNVDNSEKIKELEKELEVLISEGVEMVKRHTEIEETIKSLKELREKYDEKTKLETRKPIVELNLNNLRESFKEKNQLLKDYNQNREAIDINNKINIEINNINVRIQNKNNTKITNIRFIEQDKNNINVYKTNVEERNNLIKKIEEERILVRHWRLYLDMVGKNGISKMVLRKTLPIINAQMNSMLSNVCDFNIEIAITDKNDVMFYLIKDGVRSELTSGSGFERTASALALRTVLGSISSLPRINGFIADEIWGRVAKENYENMIKLLNKILNYYDYIIVISHLDEIKDYCNQIITVTKENNISKIHLVK